VSALSVEVARHAIHHFSKGDDVLSLDGGHFVNRLFVLLSAADAENRAKLATLYPEHVQAFEAVTQKPWGLEWLRGIAKDELDRSDRQLDFAGISA
jgi:hypothetical protein